MCLCQFLRATSCLRHGTPLMSCPLLGTGTMLIVACMHVCMHVCVCMYVLYCFILHPLPLPLSLQLSVVLSIFAAVQARHFHLSRSSIQCALATIQQAPGEQDMLPGGRGEPPNSKEGGDSSLLLNFATNMIRILGDQAESSHMQ